MSRCQRAEPPIPTPRRARWPSAALVAALVLGAAGSALGQDDAAPANAAAIDIPFEKFTLNNGLTLIVHEDDKAPIVAVNVWYHVGSKNEQPGKTGFAHLFEHLMFNGTENYPGEFFEPFERVGATGMNGTTNPDRTNYFEVVPKNALDLALWMESDRMGHLLGAVDQARLDEQRGVVQNEKRQGENQPYGRVFNVAFENIFPAGHPYSWPVIGSIEDLNAATLDDVRRWFKRFYGAANAVIVVAGDVDAQDVKARVERHFGHIPAGPPLARQKEWIPELRGVRHHHMKDRVPQARLYKFWTMPGFGSLAADQLDLVAGILSEGKTSRLYKRLVYDERVASDVSVFAFPMEIAGIFGVVATAMPGQALADINAIIDAEVATLLADGATADELQRVVATRQSGFIAGIERVGGFGGKSDLLAAYEVYLDDPAAYKTTLERWETATLEDLRAVANEWMKRGQFVLEVTPFGDYATTKPAVDRSRLPEPEEPPSVTFPPFERFTLDNGLDVILAARPALPVVQMLLMIDAGFAADQFATPGTASLALSMLNEGTRTRTALEISDELRRLGANMDTGSDLDMSVVSLWTLKEHLEASSDVFADVVLNPVFPQGDFERLQAQRIVAIKQEKAQPRGLAQRVFPTLLYGDGHAYSAPSSGTGTEASVAALTSDDLAAFHEAWFKPNNGTLIVVGDMTRAELEPLLESRFGAWQPAEVPTKNIGTVAHRSEPTVYLLDRPDSEQSVILAGHLAPPPDNEADFAIMAMNQVLGGDFTARVNMNLREDKGWSYGAFTAINGAQGQRPFYAMSPVQTDKTGEAMTELRRELTEIRDERPPTAEEIAKVKDQRTLSLPGRWETAAAVLNSISSIVRFRLEDDFWNHYANRVRGMDEADIRQAAIDIIRPDSLVWVVVGDRAKIEADVRALEFGEVVLLDDDGNPLEE